MRVCVGVSKRFVYPSVYPKTQWGGFGYTKPVDGVLMPRKIQSEKLLEATQVKIAAATGREYTLADGGGLFLFVTAEGRKRWAFRYRFAGKAEKLWIGEYPSPLERKGHANTHRRS